MIGLFCKLSYNKIQFVDSLELEKVARKTVLWEQKD